MGTTTQTNYTYIGNIPDNTEVIIKSTYANYSLCESDGAKINVTINPPTTTPISPDNNTDSNIPNTPTTDNQEPTTDFQVNFTESKEMTKTKFQTIQNELYKYISVTSGDKNITNTCSVQYQCEDEDCAADSFKVILTIKCTGYPKAKNITLSVGN